MSTLFPSFLGTSDTSSPLARKPPHPFKLKEMGYGCIYDFYDTSIRFSVDVDIDKCISFSPPTYQKWDLVRLTQNYLRLLLTYAHEGAQGILIHCISGWDRTPLFLSLLRLSLWADGLIHSSLDHLQVRNYTRILCYLYLVTVFCKVYILKQSLCFS